MRKALIAGIVASALFAVGAFAAVIGTVSGNVASNEGDVGSCAASAEVDFETDANVSPPTGATTDFTVSGATVTLIPDAGETCEGALVDLAIGSDTGTDGEPDAWVNATCDPANASGVSSCDVDSTPGPAVRPIVEVAVLANGTAVPTTTP